MSKKYLYTVLALVIIASMALAACQSAATTAPATEAPATEAPAATEAAATEAPAATEAALSGKLEVFSWWTAGGEAEGKTALFNVYSSLYPGVELVDATVAGGAGTNAKAVLATRLQAGDPPDAFQVHAGLEVEKYSPEDYLQPLDSYLDTAAYPADLLSMLEYNGHYWSVPVNIHRSNVMWYNKTVLADAGVAVPTTMDEFFAAMDTLKSKGYIPMTMGTKEGWEAAHVFEGFLLSYLGPEDYKGLWKGTIPWTDTRVTDALNSFKKMMTYVNTDNAALTWDGAAQYLTSGKAAFLIMGDWTAGWFASSNFTDYGWTATPGTNGVFIALSDSFALPKGAPDEANAEAFIKVVGSAAGQEAFNPKKGSICARIDCSDEAFKAVPGTYDYLHATAEEWKTDTIVPSIVHGAATIESWATAYKDTVNMFAADGDVAKAQTSLGQLCVDAGVCTK